MKTSIAPATPPPFREITITLTSLEEVRALYGILGYFSPAEVNAKLQAAALKPVKIMTLTGMWESLRNTLRTVDEYIADFLP